MSQKLNADYETNHHAEETLRLVAQLRPPAELAERVHRRLADEGNAPARRGFWSLWMPGQRLQFALAAALVIAVAGSTWSVYYVHPQGGSGSNAGSGAGSRAVPLPPARALPDNSGGFGSAGAERVPPTLNPIKVQPAPKKKPNLHHVLAKPSPKTLAAQPAGEATAKAPVNQ
jgi:hypothetical protein